MQGPIEEMAKKLDSVWQLSEIIVVIFVIHFAEAPEKSYLVGETGQENR